MTVLLTWVSQSTFFFTVFIEPYKPNLSEILRGRQQKLLVDRRLKNFRAIASP